MTPNDAARQIDTLVGNHLLLPHFQPIANLQSPTIYGYEALIRGSSGSGLTSPSALFEMARLGGRLIELEHHCCRSAIRYFMHYREPGKLLVNLSPAALIAMTTQQGPDLVSACHEWGLLPSRLIIELTEHDRVSDLSTLQRSIATLRKAGIGLALDDFGDGHASLRVWKELAPDLVKIDKYFVSGLNTDNDKFEAMCVLKHIAETFGGARVAEGIEEEAELAVLRDLGIGLGQGYLLGLPSPKPAPALPATVHAQLDTRKVAVFPEMKSARMHGGTARSLLIEAPAVDADTRCDAVADLFRTRQALHAVAVLEEGKPIGLINRQTFMDQREMPFRRELFGNHPCSRLMSTSPLLVEQDRPLLDLMDILRGEDQRYLNDGFVICSKGDYLGLGTGEQLVRRVTELRIEAARHASPLTFLPGNIPISDHICRLLAGGGRFAACYCDLNHFKPFNDYYGYWRGDEMIRLAAKTMTANCDPLRDFVGHVGGDDFILLMQSGDWEWRCRRIIDEFNFQARAFYDESARARGGIEGEDSRGNMRFFAFTTISIGAIDVGPGDFSRHEDVASAAASARRSARKTPGGLLVCGPPACRCDDDPGTGRRGNVGAPTLRTIAS